MAESGIPRTFWVVAALAIAAPARADLGAVLGGRLTDLEGHTTQTSTANVAGAAIVSRSLPHGFEVAVEPGLHLAGSQDYMLVYAAVAVFARFSYHVTRTERLRVLAGVVPAYLWRAYHREEVESGGHEWNRLPGFARFDVAFAAGLGVDTLIEHRRYFAELRVKRGLTTIDGDIDPLFVFNREIGLWVGFTQ